MVTEGPCRSSLIRPAKLIRTHENQLPVLIEGRAASRAVFASRHAFSARSQTDWPAHNPVHLSAIVREGTKENSLRVALGHVPGTALPGMPGNVALAGHRDRLFRPLLKSAGMISSILESLTGTYVYRVEKNGDRSAAQCKCPPHEPQPQLTLVTCYPLYYVGAAPKRFVVTARQISVIPRPAPEPQQHGSRRTDATPGESAAPPV